jgi:hypothetical protein
MKRIIFKTAAIVLILAGVIACKKEKEETSSLQGTKWKLAGYVDAATGNRIDAEPANCERCYTLTFDTETTASGYSVLNQISVSLVSEKIFSVRTLVEDSMNGNVGLFYEAISLVNSYVIESTELKFFYNGTNKYLSFKPLSAITNLSEVPIVDFSLPAPSCNWQYSRLKPDSVYHIYSEDIFSSYISCQENDAPAIDFTIHSLLVVWEQRFPGLVSSRRLIQTAPKEYLLHIDITSDMTADEQSFTIAILTQKLPLDAKVTLNKEYHY